MNSSLDTVCLRVRDTKMADSNCCQAIGHVGETQELARFGVPDTTCPGDHLVRTLL